MIDLKFDAAETLQNSSVEVYRTDQRCSYIVLALGQAAQKQQRPRCPNHKMYLEIRSADEGALSLKSPSSALLTPRYILRLGQAAQKQQRPRCPNSKMYLEIRRADEWLFKDQGLAHFIQLFRGHFLAEFVSHNMSAPSK